MKVAIVGTSRLSEVEEMDARKLIALLLKDYMKDYLWVQVISGGAKGIDTLAAQVAYGLGIPITVYEPNSDNWPGFRQRNLFIVDDCDELICITTKTKNEKCYHCNEDHQRSGGCWTMKKAKELNKPTRLFIL